jgi:glutamate formiminotransferase/formiminotetrahydrofolate cyclodeaminase
MKKQLIECVPNFSEGRDRDKIREITDSISKIKGIKLLNVDPGKTTNRTVVTFIGDPESVIEAAFRGIKNASEVIDMRLHHGEHPRMGATDVCPLVPISNISMEEVVEYAHVLGYRVGEELGIPGYYYEYAAKIKARSNLAYCRSGEYEGLKKKLQISEWEPDFGPSQFNARTGATAIGARDFLVAYNVNLNTTSTRRANAIACDLREKGRIKRIGDPLTGKMKKDKDGNPVYIPGSLKHVKGIGWYIDEYGIAQLSLNLTNINETPIHIAFDEACRCAEARGIRVTGSELVGLVPLKAILDAGKYFLRKQKRSLGIPEHEIVKIAIKSLGLDDLAPFNPKERIIEYMLEKGDEQSLILKNLTDFAEVTASESPAPGGGSISAYAGALGAALGTMVANLSAHKRGWDDRWEEFSLLAVNGQKIIHKLLYLVDEDTRAFDAIIQAMRLPKSTKQDKEIRKQAIEQATKNAIEVPFSIMKEAIVTMNVLKQMAEKGLESSISDVGVGVACTRSAVLGAYLNVKINCQDLEDKAYVKKMLGESEKIKDQAFLMESEILQIVENKIEDKGKT